MNVCMESRPYTGQIWRIKNKVAIVCSHMNMKLMYDSMIVCVHPQTHNKNVRSHSYSSECKLKYDGILCLHPHKSNMVCVQI